MGVPSLSAEVIAGVIAVIVPIQIAVVIVIGIVLFYILMWKFQNDFFNKYLCCCLVGGFKAHMNSLKQEMYKLSSSGKSSQGQLLSKYYLL